MKPLLLSVLFVLLGPVSGALAVPASAPGAAPDAPAEGLPADASAPTPPAASAPPAMAVVGDGAGIWRGEFLLAWQPDQTRDVICNRGLDCTTPARSYFAGAARLTFERPERYAFGVTLGFGHALDQERLPVDGYQIVSLRGDFQFEFGRTSERFGLALRVSPVVLVGWSATGAAFRTDIPGFAVLLGRSDLWVEISVPVIPTHADPRFFSVGLGWKQPRYTLKGGFATFSSLTYAHDAIGRTGAGPGAWVRGVGRLSVESPWEGTVQLNLSGSTSVSLGVGYRFPRAE